MAAPVLCLTCVVNTQLQTITGVTLTASNEYNTLCGNGALTGKVSRELCV
jgi:hypothetical protein